MRIIVLAALAEEADAFMAGAGKAPGTGWPATRQTEFNGHALFIATCGIGKVNAAAAAAQLHALHRADMFIMTGTAGKIGTLQGDCFYLSRAAQHDYGARRGDSFIHYDPGAYPLGPAHLSHYRSLPDPGVGLPHATIVSGDAFIEDAAYARHLVAALDGDLVDMETAAIAQFARIVGLPWAAVKATTDDANHDSAADFHTNLLTASRRAAQAVEKLITLL